MRVSSHCVIGGGVRVGVCEFGADAGEFGAQLRWIEDLDRPSPAGELLGEGDDEVGAHRHDDDVVLLRDDREVPAELGLQDRQRPGRTADPCRDR